VVKTFPTRWLALSGLAGCLSVLALTADAGAQPKRTAPHTRPLIVEEIKNDAWRVTVSVDKPDLTYDIGDEVRITVTSDQGGYLYVFDTDATGNIVCLFPNDFQKKNEIAAGATVNVPDPADRLFRIRVGAPAGKEKVTALVTKQPLAELKLPDLTRSSSRPGRPRKPVVLSPVKMKRLVVEVMGGDPNTAGPDPGVNNPGPADPGPVSAQKEKEKLQQEKPQQFQQKMREWAAGCVEITTVEGKPKPPTPQQGGKPEQGKPEQGGKVPPPAPPAQGKPSQGGK
jgi:hypothetical protein